MADVRHCDQCGTLFAPRREHARFCSARCRVAWSGAHLSGPGDEMSPLHWSITAMRESTSRVRQVRTSDLARGFTAISEAVWWVTIVDATLLRHHPQAYDRVMAAHGSAERELIEGTLGGLRFVRNQMGNDRDLAGFICPEARPPDSGDSRITEWTWRSVPEPELAPLTARGQAWELTRYKAYQANLAGQTIGATFGRVAAFLDRTAEQAA